MNRREPSELAALAIPLHAWGGTSTPAGRLAVLEADVRTLIADLARARSTAAEHSEAHDHELRRLFLALVGVLDGFDRVFERADEAVLADGTPSPWIDNFRTVVRMLRGVLTDHGVHEIELNGSPFDPAAHTVTETVTGGRSDEGTVVGQVQPGYRWRGTVLRKAEVTVVRAGEDHH